VFRGYSDICTVQEMLEGPEGGDYVMGVDLARHQDFTVICVMDARTGRYVYGERFNKLDWEFIEDRIIHVSELFDAPMLVDSTGVGDRVVSALQNACDQPVEGFHFSNLRKVNLIRQYALAMANKEIELFGRECTTVDGKQLFGRVFMGEHGAFRYDKTEAGTLKMQAPKGRFDDCVISGALAYEAGIRFAGLTPSKSTGNVGQVKGSKTYEEIMLTEHSEDEEGEEAAPKISGTFGRAKSVKVGRGFNRGRRRSKGSL
jgi:hypothetical protein